VKISEHLEKVLAKCTELEPAKRYQSIAELQAALFGPPEERDTKPEAKTREAQQIQAKPPAPTSPDNHVKPSYEPVASFFNMYKPYAALAVFALVVILTGIVLIKSTVPWKPAPGGAIRGYPSIQSNPPSTARSVSTMSVAHTGVTIMPSNPPMMTPSPFPSGGKSSSPEPYLQLDKASPAPTESSAYVPTLPGFETSTGTAGSPCTSTPDERKINIQAASGPTISTTMPVKMSVPEYLARVLNKNPGDFSRTSSIGRKDRYFSGIDSDYEIKIPPDYLEVRMRSPIFLNNERVFAIIDPKQGEKSLRIITIMKSINTHLDNEIILWNKIDDTIRERMNSCQTSQIKNIEPMDTRYLTKNKGLEYTYLVNQGTSETLPFTMKCEQVFYFVKDPGILYALAALAHPDNFRFYEREFREYFKNCSPAN